MHIHIYIYAISTTVLPPLISPLPFHPALPPSLPSFLPSLPPQGARQGGGGGGTTVGLIAYATRAHRTSASLCFRPADACDTGRMVQSQPFFESLNCPCTC